MMTRTIHILLIFLLGFNIVPRTGVSCDIKSGKSLVEPQTLENSGVKDCCKKQENYANQNGDHCGNCGENACQCPATHISSIINFSQEAAKKSDIFSDNEQILSYKQAHLSNGFYSIWTPPNIS
ncbi:MAG: hypothetical protein ACOH2A_08720 [Sphingobacteriaceae bacterium]